MATAGVINTDTNVKSNKVGSLVVLDRLECQGLVLFNGNNMYANAGCKAQKSTNISIGDGATVTINNWGTEVDPTGSFDLASGTWTCPVTGNWNISATVFFAAAGGTVRGINIIGTAAAFNSPNGVNFSQIVGGTGATATVTSVTWSYVLPIQRTETLNIQATQTSGGAVNVTHANFTATLVYK